MGRAVISREHGRGGRLWGHDHRGADSTGPDVLSGRDGPELRRATDGLRPADPADGRALCQAAACAEPDLTHTNVNQGGADERSDADE